jgi:hypothetical protein
VSALTVCLDIDALIVLKDLRGLTDAEAKAEGRWMARVLLDASLREVGRGRVGEAPSKGPESLHLLQRLWPPWTQTLANASAST